MAPYRGRRNIGRKVLIHHPKLVETPLPFFLFLWRPTNPPSHHPTITIWPGNIL